MFLFYLCNNDYISYNLLDRTNTFDFPERLVDERSRFELRRVTFYLTELFRL